MDTQEQTKVVFIRLDGFTRYDIYPDGRVYDNKSKCNIHPNREGNFAMYPDITSDFYKVHKESGKQLPYIDNIRHIISWLVKEKTPGFTVELGENLAHDLYNPLSYLGRNTEEAYGSDLQKELYYLKKAHNEAVISLVSKTFLELSKDLQETIQQRWKDSYDALEEFKQLNPRYYKWKHWSPIPKKGTKKAVKKIEEYEYEAEIAANKVNIYNNLIYRIDMILFELRSKFEIKIEKEKPSDEEFFFFLDLKKIYNEVEDDL